MPFVFAYNLMGTFRARFEKHAKGKARHFAEFDGQKRNRVKTGRAGQCTFCVMLGSLRPWTGAPP